MLFLGILTLSCFFEDEILIGIICGVITLITASYSFNIFRIASCYVTYANIINNGFFTIEELKNKIGKNEAEVIDDIDDIIANKIFLNVYLDKEHKRIEILEISSQNSLNNSSSYLAKYSKANISNKILKEIYCPNCGALIQKRSTAKIKCEYCGNEF